MKSHARKTGALLLCSLLASAALTTGCTTSQTLAGTHWRLTQIGDEIVDNPAGDRDVHFVLQTTDPLVAGNAGCNRMFGHYALQGDEIRFDQMGGTKMFCEARMDLEQKFLGMFDAVSRWKISGNTLQLLDGTGRAVGTFEAE